jgi:nucleoside-diphosphate-sugar epimerase
MRILFAGASSFTGYWFVRELVAAGHEVVAACRGDWAVRRSACRARADVRELCETRFDCAFGNDDFLALAKTPSLKALRSPVTPGGRAFTMNFLARFFLWLHT